MSSNVCPQCHSEGSIISDLGRRVCRVCGCVLQEQALVNELTFVDNANGTASVTGQFIPNAGPTGLGSGVSTQTVTEGQNIIASICEKLPRLSPDAVDFATRIYQIAVKHRFTRGRTIEIVAAAAVYLSIRCNRNSGYLLDDIGQHVHCGIYELAATALRLAHAVNQPIPSIDPVLYITRFLDEIDLGRNQKAVHDTAIHIVHRLDRDWIQTGRKPTGVVGTAIMIACRMHGVTVSKDKIREIARVCVSTINKRLKEISETELAKKSIDELKLSETILDDDSRELPPIMKKEKVKKEIEAIADEIRKEDKGEEILNDDDFDDPDLKQVDEEILPQEERDKKLAIYYAMFKNTLNAPPKEPKPKRQKKQKRTHNFVDEDASFVQDSNIQFAQNEEIEDGDDDFDGIAGDD